MLYAQYLIKKQENFNYAKKIIQGHISQFELRFTVKNKKTKNQIRKIKKFLTSKFLTFNEIFTKINGILSCNFQF